MVLHRKAYAVSSTLSICYVQTSSITWKLSSCQKVLAALPVVPMDSRLGGPQTQSGCGIKRNILNPARI
jgi:hypothetical protein